MPAARAAILALSAAAAQAAADDLTLALPLDCVLGEDCYIQQLVDHDPGPSAVDFRCGSLTYDGHKGTDFALPTFADLSKDVAVLAAAPGRVTATRDGMPDLGRTGTSPEDIAGRECGNGVVIRHADGYVTQYCHLKRGSVTLREGDHVGQGDRLGAVGLSGLTDFPHLHFSVRRNGRVVDPFDAGASLSKCGSSGGAQPLWHSPPEAPPGGVTHVGFATAIPEYDSVRAGAVTAPENRNVPALVLYALVFGGQTGDVLRFDIQGPDGAVLTEEADLLKNQALVFRAVGRRRGTDPWPAGRYMGTVRLIRDGRALPSKSVSIVLN